MSLWGTARRSLRPQRVAATGFCAFGDSSSQPPPLSPHCRGEGGSSVLVPGLSWCPGLFPVSHKPSRLHLTPCAGAARGQGAQVPKPDVPGSLGCPRRDSRDTQGWVVTKTLVTGQSQRRKAEMPSVPLAAVLPADFSTQRTQGSADEESQHCVVFLDQTSPRYKITSYCS